jgi:hypothetical protein
VRRGTKSRLRGSAENPPVIHSFSIGRRLPRIGHLAHGEHAVSPKLQLFASDVQIGAKTTITDRDGPQIAKVFLQTCLSAVCLSNLLKASIFPM